MLLYDFESVVCRIVVAGRLAIRKAWHTEVVFVAGVVVGAAYADLCMSTRGALAAIAVYAAYR